MTKPIKTDSIEECGYCSNDTDLLIKIVGTFVPVCPSCLDKIQQNEIESIHSDMEKNA